MSNPRVAEWFDSGSDKVLQAHVDGKWHDITLGEDTSSSLRDWIGEAQSQRMPDKGEIVAYLKLTFDGKQHEWWIVSLDDSDSLWLQIGGDGRDQERAGHWGGLDKREFQRLVRQFVRDSK